MGETLGGRGTGVARTTAVRVRATPSMPWRRLGGASYPDGPLQGARRRVEHGASRVPAQALARAAARSTRALMPLSILRSITNAPGSLSRIQNAVAGVGA